MNAPARRVGPDLERMLKMTHSSEGFMKRSAQILGVLALLSAVLLWRRESGPHGHHLEAAQFHGAAERCAKRR